MSKKMILVVEDEDTTIQLLEYALDKSGYKVSIAKNGNIALNNIKEVNPDLIILDLVMPDMDGFTFIQKIKDIPSVKDIPLIVSSGKNGMEDFFELEDEAHRPEAFLAKPYKMNLLLETVAKLLGQ